MSADDTVPPKSPSEGSSFDVNEVFEVLKFPMRRNLLVALARGGPQTSEQLKDTGPYSKGGAMVFQRLDTTAQHLKILVRAGILIQDVDPRDRRRPRYALSPSLHVSFEDNETVIDFGFFVARLTGRSVD